MKSLSLLAPPLTRQGVWWPPPPGRRLPRKPITLVVPFPAGSGTDAVGRIFGSELSAILGQQIVVENKPGANATIAASYVARAKPDGYTLFITTNTSHSAAPWLMKNVPYDPVKDFTPIARGGNLPFILVTNPKRPWKTVGDLVADARQHPGRITYAEGQRHRHRRRRHLGQPPRQDRHPACPTKARRRA